MDDVKPRRLWPNDNEIETYVPTPPDDYDDLNYDFQFYSPNFMNPDFYKEESGHEDH